MKFFPYILFIIIAGASCSSDKKDNTSQQKQLSDTIIKTDTITTVVNDCKTYFTLAKKQDSIMLQAVEANDNEANKAIKAFTDFAYFCHTDTLAPVYLIKAAQVARSINNVRQAKVVLERCIENYPRFKNLPAAMFLLAQLYDDETFLNNDLEAEKMYKEIIYNYPNSEWAVSAKGALKFIGKSDAQIMQELKKK